MVGNDEEGRAWYNQMRVANEESQDVERLYSSFGVAFRNIGSHAPRENNRSMVSRNWAEQLSMNVSWVALVVSALLSIWGFAQLS